MARIALEGGPDEPVSMLAPAKTLTELSKLSSMAEEIKVTASESHAIFSIASVQLTSRLIEGSFPDYARLLPESFAREYTTSGAALGRTLGRVNLFSKPGSSGYGGPSPITLDFRGADESSSTGGTLTVSGSSEEKGSGKEVLKATAAESASGGSGKRQDRGAGQHGSFRIAFNGGYLAEAVQKVVAGGDGQVKLKANEPLAPAIIEPSGEGKSARETLYLIMPMRSPEVPQQEGSAEKSSATAGGHVPTEASASHNGDAPDREKEAESDIAQV